MSDNHDESASRERGCIAILLLFIVFFLWMIESRIPAPPTTQPPPTEAKP